MCRKGREVECRLNTYFQSALFNYLVKYVVGTIGDGPVQCTYHPQCTDISGNEMETSFSTFKPEPEMAAANPLYDSTYRLTGLPGCKSAASHPLYESTFTVKEEMGEVNNGVNDDKDEGIAKI